MSGKKEQVAPIRKPMRPSKPPTKKKTEVTQTCGGINAMDTLQEMEKIKRLPALSSNPRTPTVQGLEQTRQEGEVWLPNEPTTIDELMGQIADCSLEKDDVTCPFHFDGAPNIRQQL